MTDLTNETVETMEPKIYTITLADGTTISNLTLNGNNFISKKPIDATIFDGNLSTVKIATGETEETYVDMELIHLTKMRSFEEYPGFTRVLPAKDGDESLPGEISYWFVLREIPEQEMFLRRLRSDLDYVGMMSDLEL